MVGIIWQPIQSSGLHAGEWKGVHEHHVQVKICHPLTAYSRHSSEENVSPLCIDKLVAYSKIYPTVPTDVLI